MDPRVTKCLAAKRESRAVEFKEQFIPTDAKQSLEVLKDIVAIANSGGGALAVGINNAGEASGTDVSAVLSFDHAKYCDLIRKYTLQNYCAFDVVEAEKDEQRVAVFLINPPDAPLVFEKPGTYPVGNNRQQNAFGQGTVYFRHGAKSETGTSEDLRKFMEQRMREMQDQLMKGLRKVSVSPRGSHLEVVTAKGIITTGTPTGVGNALTVRITNNKHAQNAVLLDKSELFPYRQKDVLAKLKDRLTAQQMPNLYDLQAINRVHNIADEDRLSWKPQFSARQYSDAFVDWILAKAADDATFFQETRRRLHEMNGHK
jgi:hypothetical protein